MQLKEIIRALEDFAPLVWQEPYDNSGLITGHPDDEVKGALVTLDCTEAVVQEAMDRGSNLIIAHHPILFKGVKKLTGANYVERTLLLAIKNNIALYALHTNLDNILHGVNQKIAEKLSLQHTRILTPKKGTLSKLVTFVPVEETHGVLSALHQAGAGQIGNYKNCSFQVEGTGSFLPEGQASPHIGTLGKQEQVKENRVEVIYPSWLEPRIMDALRSSHPYEEVAYYSTLLTNENQEIGSGMIGEIEQDMDIPEFLTTLKARMGLKHLRYTHGFKGKIKKIALCGGSGSFLLGDAIRSGAQAFITSDFKYHDFFDAEDRILVADIGHYESEVFTKDLIYGHLSKKFPTFAINFSKTDTNPISYF